MKKYILQTAHTLWNNLVKADQHANAYNYLTIFLTTYGLTDDDFHAYILEKNGWIS